METSKINKIKFTKEQEKTLQELIARNERLIEKSREILEDKPRPERRPAVDRPGDLLGVIDWAIGHKMPWRGLAGYLSDDEKELLAAVIALELRRVVPAYKVEKDKGAAPFSRPWQWSSDKVKRPAAYAASMKAEMEKLLGS